MAKPPVRQVPSDDCVVEIDGKEYRLHEGESVSVVSSFAVGDLKLMRRVAGLQSEMDDLDDEEQMRKVMLMDDTFDEMIDVLQRRIVAWNWTDDQSRPLPQPHGNPDAFRSLRITELMYLALAVKGESPAESGNGSVPSPNTSSATPRRKRRTKSSGGLSHSKA